MANGHIQNLRQGDVLRHDDSGTRSGTERNGAARIFSRYGFLAVRILRGTESLWVGGGRLGGASLVEVGRLGDGASLASRLTG